MTIKLTPKLKKVVSTVLLKISKMCLKLNISKMKNKNASRDNSMNKKLSL